MTAAINIKGAWLPGDGRLQHAFGAGPGFSFKLDGVRLSAEFGEDWTITRRGGGANGRVEMRHKRGLTVTREVRTFGASGAF
ncbi:hypothetical protein DSM104635_01780 [Terricaulis silvestris]|uniref:Uncharacterized protein n=1 Tax=Terricaulis silvestris TaxID=2686094 RepID=A0A6I6MIL1_9CAUL|nr:hypothetical protein DSM104635_01780 [Terricaulis silvestris]